MCFFSQGWLHYVGGRGLWSDECGCQWQNAEICTEVEVGKEKRAGFWPVGWVLLSCPPPPYKKCPLWADHHCLVCVRGSVIEEANWLTLAEDVQKPGDGFDAVICLGNSFAHLPDFKGGSLKQSNLLKTHFTRRSSCPRTSDWTLCVVMPVRGPEWPEVGPAEHRQHGQARWHPHHRSPQLWLHPGDRPGASGKEHLL